MLEVVIIEETEQKKRFLDFYNWIINIFFMVKLPFSTYKKIMLVRMTHTGMTWFHWYVYMTHAYSIQSIRSLESLRLNRTIKFFKKILFLKTEKSVYNVCKLYCNNIKVQSKSERIFYNCFYWKNRTQQIL